MEELTIKQKRFIELNRSYLTPNEIAKRINTTPSLVGACLNLPKNAKPIVEEKPTDQPSDNLKDLFDGCELIFFGLILANILVYINILGNEFISDDIDSIVNNVKIGDVFYTIVNGNTGSVLNSLIFNITKLNPMLYHIDSLLWHIGATILVFLITRVLGNKYIASIAAFFYAVHPIHAEAVTWISGLPYLTYTFFTLATVLLVILIDKSNLSKKWLILAGITTFLALYSSEKAVMLPILIGAYFFVFSSWKKGVTNAWPIILVTGLFSLQFLGRLGGRVSSVTPSYENTSVFFNPLIQIPTAISIYIKLLLLPVGLTLYHEDLRMTPIVFGLFCTILIVLILFMILLYIKKQKLLFFSCIIFFIGLIPTLLPIKISWVVAERYLYLSSWGFFIIGAVLFYQLFKKTKIGFWLVFIPLFLFYSILTINRNSEWHNADTMWPATLRESPTSSLAYNNMGDYYGRHGDLPHAIEAFGKAVEIRPQYPAAIHNLGNAYLQSGNASKAAELFEKAIALNPTLLESLVNLGIINTKLGNYQKAEKYLAKAEKSHPESSLVYVAWGTYYYDRHDVSRAKQMFEKALQLNPNDQNAIQSLSVVNQQLQQNK